MSSSKKTAFYLLLLCAVFFQACNEHRCEVKEARWNASDKNALDELVDFCQDLALRLDSGIMLGHKESLAYGSMWYNQPGRSDVKSVSGHYPAVVDWTLTGIESGANINVDSVPFVRIKQYVTQMYHNEGVTVLSWAPAWQQTWVGMADEADSILTEEEFFAHYAKGLDCLAAFLLALKNDSEQYIPVVVQLFDWPNIQEVCPAGIYIDLWRKSVDYLRDKKNIHHVLYAYSMNGVETGADLSRYYPGNAYVDIVGLRLYQDFETDGSGSLYGQRLEKGLSAVCHFAQKNKKLPALSETGLKGVKISNFFSGILDPVISKYKISYMVFGANMWNEEESYYVPIPGHPASEDFFNFAHNSHIIMCKNQRGNK